MTEQPHLLSDAAPASIPTGLSAVTPVSQPSVFATWPGVVLGDADSAHVGVPEHFGDPSGEQWALESGAGIVDRGDLSVLCICGPDRLTWLTSISSQQLTDMQAGSSRELLILNAQGHIQHAAGVLEDGERTWLITARSRAASFAQWLDSMRFMSRVQVTHSDAVIFQTVTPRPMPDHAEQTASNLDALSIPEQPLTWVDPWPDVADGAVAYFGGQHPASRHRVQLFITSANTAAAFAQTWLDADTGRRPAGLLAAEAVRVADWRPSITSDVDDRTLPAELDWLRTAVHTNKGCYPGQESVARILNMGRPPRRLTLLQLDGSLGELPAPGTALTWENRAVGTVTSVARHADEGPIALALINRAVPAHAVFDIDGVAAAQELIVPLSGRPVGAQDRSRPTLKANPALRHADMRGAASGGLAPTTPHRRSVALPDQAKRQPAATSKRQEADVLGHQGENSAGCACGRHTSPKETRTVSESGEDRTPDGFVATPAGATTFGLGGNKGGKRGGHHGGSGGGLRLA